MTTINCIRCEKTVASIDNNILQCQDGVIFTSFGNYGSRILDLFSDRKQVLIGICDSCLDNARERKSVFVSSLRPAPDPSLTLLEDWNELES